MLTLLLIVGLWTQPHIKLQRRSIEGRVEVLQPFRQVWRVERPEIWYL